MTNEDFVRKFYPDAVLEVNESCFVIYDSPTARASGRKPIFVWRGQKRKKWAWSQFAEHLGKDKEADKEVQ